MRSKLLTKLFSLLAVALGVSVFSLSANPSYAQSVSAFPGDVAMSDSASDIWREIKEGKLGKTTSPDKSRGYLIRSKGEDWRTIRNQYVFVYGSLSLGVMLGALVLFYLLRGPITLDGEPTGRKVLRFKTIERVNHWTMAASFIVLGLTGLNILYGRAVLVPVIGHDAFSAIASAGKFAHNNIAWLFMVSLVFTAIFWTKDNLWDRYDFNWILKGGGLFSKGSHPPSARFNFGEKTMFWLVILGGIAVSYTGLTLLFPNALGALPTMQLMQLVHAITALVMVIAIMGHIYIGTIGIQGALDSMTTGYVDETWAKEHHSAWAEKQGIEVDHNPSDEEYITQGGIAE